MRAVVYSRVSRDMRDTGRSVREQNDEGLAEVERNQWRLVATKSDNDRSASKYAKKDRPDWQRVTQMIEAGEVDVLVVWEPSRATRDRLVWATLAAMCEEHDVQISASNRLYDLEDPDDAFQLDLFFALGTRESGITRKRVMRTVRANAIAGTPHGRMLFGYRREYNPSTGELLRQVPDDVPRLGQDAINLVFNLAFARILAEAGDPARLLQAWPALRRLIARTPIPPTTVIAPYTRAGIVREIAARSLAGDALHRLSMDLDRRGIRTSTGRPWSGLQVRQVILNPGYAGMRVHRGKVIGPAKWPPLLSEADHFALVAKLTDPDRHPRRDMTVAHLLTGIAICGVCGAPARMIKNRGYRMYQCGGTGPAVGGVRFHVARRETRLDSHIRELLVGRLSAPDAVALIARDDAEAGRLRGLMDKVADKRARLKQFYNQAASGDLSPAGLAVIERTLLAEIEAAQRKAKSIQLVPLIGDLISPDPEVVAYEYDRMGMDRKREVITALFEKIEILSAGGKTGVSLYQTIRVTWRQST